MVHRWAQLRDSGSLSSRDTGSPHQKNRDAVLAENKQLRRKLEQTEKRLHKAELLVELKKISALMDLESQNDTDRNAAL